MQQLRLVLCNNTHARIIPLLVIPVVAPPFLLQEPGLLAATAASGRVFIPSRTRVRRFLVPKRPSLQCHPQALKFLDRLSLSPHQVNNRDNPLNHPPNSLPTFSGLVATHPHPPRQLFHLPGGSSIHLSPTTNCSRLPLPVYQDSKFPQLYCTVRSTRVRQHQNFNKNVRSRRQCHRPDGHHLPR
jgi:hypothetical protein